MAKAYTVHTVTDFMNKIATTINNSFKKHLVKGCSIHGPTLISYTTGNIKQLSLSWQESQKENLIIRYLQFRNLSRSDKFPL